MPTSEAILEQLKSHYHTGVVDYRDRMLACGRLIHQYVLAYLTERAGATEQARWRVCVSRRQAMANVCAAMGVQHNRRPWRCGCK